jgi:hypothetical protein
MLIEIVCWSQFLLTLESNPKRSLSGRRHRYGIFQYIEQLANARTSSQILVRRSCIRRFSSFPPASNCRIRELARWEKYAYGTNELVFNPLKKWFKGPITSLYLSYFMSHIKPSSKLMVLSYSFTYYAIAAGLPLSLVNYLIVGWFSNTLDQFYVTSWRVIVVTLIIFNVIVSLCSKFSRSI